MSKYNDIRSIPVESIPKEELGRAIHEWAEGSSSMERLLWACYDYKIETSGCHAGIDPFLGFYLNDNNENISRILNITEKTPYFQILYKPDGGNPFSGPNWDKPNLTIGIFDMNEENANEYFNNISDALYNQTNGEYNPLLSLFEYFKNKDSFLSFRLRNIKDKCVFSIETDPISKELTDFYQELFTKAGLERKVISKEHEADGRYSWQIEDDNIDKLYMKIDQAREIIEENFHLRPPINANDINTYNQRALMMKKKLSPEEFDKWLEEKRIERNELMKKRSI